MPCHNTYGRVLQNAINVEEMERVVGTFLAELAAAKAGSLVVIDGTTIRGTIPTGECRGLHLLSAYPPCTYRTRMEPGAS